MIDGTPHAMIFPNQARRGFCGRSAEHMQLHPVPRFGLENRDDEVSAFPML
jgi:hypothetical protein